MATETLRKSAPDAGSDQDGQCGEKHGRTTDVVSARGMLVRLPIPMKQCGARDEIMDTLC